VTAYAASKPTTVGSPSGSPPPNIFNDVDAAASGGGGALILYHADVGFGGGGGILFLRPEGADLSIEVRTQQVMPRAGTMKNLTVIPGSNTRIAPTPITVRKNFVDTPLTVTIPAGSTVVAVDAVNTVAFAAADILTVKLDFSLGAGVLGFGFSCTMEYV